jgi:hypothetical protein
MEASHSAAQAAQRPILKPLLESSETQGDFCPARLLQPAGC